MKRTRIRMLFIFTMIFMIQISLANPLYAEQEWQAIEIPSYSEEQATPMAFAADKEGNLIVVYTVHDSSGTILPYPMATRFDGEGWAEMGEGYLAEWSGGQFLIRVHEETGQIFVGFVTINGVIHIYEYKEGEWEELSSPGRLTRIDPQFVYYDFQVMQDGALVAAYVDLLEESSITAKAYRDGSWTTLGESGFTRDSARGISLAIDEVNHLIYAGVVIDRSEIEVWRYVEDSNWEETDNSGIGSDYPYWVKLAMGNGNRPILVFMDTELEWKICGYYYGKGIWYPMESNPFSPPLIRTFAMVMNHDGWPVVFFNDSENANRLSAMWYNGTAWGYYGSRGFTAGNVSTIFAGMDSNGTPFAFAMDPDREGQIVKLKYGEIVETGVLSSEEPAETTIEAESQDMELTEELKGEQPLFVPLVLGGAAVVILIFLLNRRKENDDK